MAKKSTPPIKLNRHQLYVLAAKATFAENTTLVIDATSQDDAGGFMFALVPDEDRRAMNEELNLEVETHENGWAYFWMNQEGHIRVMNEEAVAER
jgi:hypothetical protein